VKLVQAAERAHLTAFARTAWRPGDESGSGETLAAWSDATSRRDDAPAFDRYVARTVSETVPDDSADHGQRDRALAVLDDVLRREVGGAWTTDLIGS